MISVKNIFPFIPGGEIALKFHPSKALYPKGVSSIVKELDLNIDSNTSSSWSIKTIDNCQEELYWRSRTVVWSKNGLTIKTFTGYENVCDAFWHVFHAYPNRPSWNESTCGLLGTPFPSICIREPLVLKVYFENGQYFTIALPFPVRKIWSSKFGLIIEPVNHSSSSVPLKLSALLHPLDDITLVKCKFPNSLITNGSKSSSTSNKTFTTLDSEVDDRVDLPASHRIVFTCDNPSICITFCYLTGLHSVWSICPATLSNPESSLKSLITSKSSVPNSVHVSPNSTAAILTAGTTGFSRSAGGGVSATAKSQPASPSALTRILTSGFGCRNTPPVGASSFGVTGFAGASPFSALSAVCQSPSSSVNAFRQFTPGRYSVINSACASPTNIKTTAFSTPSSAKSSRLGQGPNVSIRPPEMFPPEITISLDHIWTEQKMTSSHRPVRNNLPASKVFLSLDFIGQRFLCLMRASPDWRLCIIRYNLANTDDNKTSTFIFGACNAISAIDAAPLPGLHIIAVLDPPISASISLYSGPLRIARVNISHCELSDFLIGSSSYAFPAVNQNHQLIKEISALNLMDSSRSHLGTPSHTSSACNSKRNSIVTSSRPPSAVDAKFDDSLSFMSPVNLFADSTITNEDKFCNSSVLRPFVKRREVGETFSQIMEFSPDSILIACTSSESNFFISYLRLQLPPSSSSSLVKRTLSTVCRTSLSKELALQLQTSWYATRNAYSSIPTTVTAEYEWTLFCQCLLGFSGYRKVHLNSLSFSPTTVSATTTVSPQYSPLNKKMKQNLKEKQLSDDWQHLLESHLHKQVGIHIDRLFGFESCKSSSVDLNEEAYANDKLSDLIDPLDSDAPFYMSLPSILWTLHLLYEDDKLDKNKADDLPLLVSLLFVLATDLRLDNFVDHYWLDFPIICNRKTIRRLRPTLSLKSMNFPSNLVIDSPPPSIQQCLQDVIGRTSLDQQIATLPFPYIEGITDRSMHLLLCYYILSIGMNSSIDSNKQPADVNINNIVRKLNIPGNRRRASAGVSEMLPNICFDKVYQHSEGNFSSSNFHTVCVKLCELLVEFSMDNRHIDTIPDGFSLPIKVAIMYCRQIPPYNWSKDAYHLIDRQDLVRQFTVNKGNTGRHHSILPANCPTTFLSEGLFDSNMYSRRIDTDTLDEEDSLSELELDSNKKALNFPSLNMVKYHVDYSSLDSQHKFPIASIRWPKDKRFSEARKLLCSSRPVSIVVSDQSKMSDHEFVEEQERCLAALCVRTMALSVGRGAITLGTFSPLPCEPLKIPKLCLSGKAPPRGTTVELDHIDVVPNMERWPTFHNGVAAGLRILINDNKTGSAVDSTWIMLNQPNKKSDWNHGDGGSQQWEHAGFLMALGLNGHLEKLGKWDSFDYLVKGNEMISIGLTIGTAASKCGSMDLNITKNITTQLEALLPLSATDLPLTHSTQVAAIISIGLLYYSTGHRLMAEVCLGELDRAPDYEVESCVDRESYSLSAGLALGMITFGKGQCLSNDSLTHLRLPDTLYLYMMGGSRNFFSNGKKAAFRSDSPNRFNLPGHSVDAIDIDVTSPGATMALGMFFFASGNKNIADWMSVPENPFLLEFVRPDFLMLRTLSRGLIMWNDIKPTSKWVESHIPLCIRKHCLVRPVDGAPPNGPIDYETINQAYCNIIAGAVMVMAFRYAGSADQRAFEVVHKKTLMLISISKRSVAELAGKAIIEQTICLHVLALGIIMAGTGHLDVFRLVRFLRARVGSSYSTVTYGSHMALHMALGLLFLGGGRYTLSNEPKCVAAMICAFFPKFPTHSNDNRYHLQALRHLYVLAIEPRLLIPRDISTELHVSCFVKVETKDNFLLLKAPVMLPQLRYIKSVSICDERYHLISFKRDSDGKNSGNWDLLCHILTKRSGQVDVKRRIGCLPYEIDPTGHSSFRSLCVTSDVFSFQWYRPQWLHGDVCSTDFAAIGGVENITKIFQSDTPKFAPSSNRGNFDAELLLRQLIGSLIYECSTHENMDLLPLLTSTFVSLGQFNHKPLISGQLAVLLDFAKNLGRCSLQICGGKENETKENISKKTNIYNAPRIFSFEIATSIEQTMHRMMDEWFPQISGLLRRYLNKEDLMLQKGESVSNLFQLTSFLTLTRSAKVVRNAALKKSLRVDDRSPLGLFVNLTQLNGAEIFRLKNGLSV